MRIEKGEWWDSTISPITGCSPASEGCRNCWARDMARRFPSLHPGEFRNVRIKPLEEAPWLDKLQRARKPRIVGLSWLGDLFHCEVDYRYIVRLVSELLCPVGKHQFVILTKRFGRACRLSVEPYNICSPSIMLGVSIADRADEYDLCCEEEYWDTRIPLRHIEPLLGPIDHLTLDGVEWIVVGGENGPHARANAPGLGKVHTGPMRSRRRTFLLQGLGPARASRLRAARARRPGAQRVPGTLPPMGGTRRKGTAEMMPGPIPQAPGLFGPLLVDNFAGGGGASLAIEQATGRQVNIAINHDPVALAIHQANHPWALHMSEDVFDIDPAKVCAGWDVDLAWFSPDCTHFSKAKGGKPVSKKIRGLAWVALRWARAVRPRLIFLENVEEFQTWGPLGPDGRPDPDLKGSTFRRFVKAIEGAGYNVEWKCLRACDYGAPTTRKRLFLVARADLKPVVWPAPTHGPGRAKPYRTAAECIDWDLPCPSIFERKRPLCEATLRRIARGIKKFVLEASKPFIIQEANRPSSGNANLVAVFLAKHFGGHYTGAGVGLGAFLAKLRGTSTAQGMDEPLHTISAQGGHFAKVCAFLVKYYGTATGAGLKEPMPTITAKDRLGLVQIRGQDYAIVDIGMRMLQPHELLVAQGFPPDYRIDIEFNGRPISKTAKVKMIGNSVSPPVARALIEANWEG